MGEWSKVGEHGKTKRINNPLINKTLTESLLITEPPETRGRTRVDFLMSLKKGGGEGIGEGRLSSQSFRHVPERQKQLY